MHAVWLDEGSINQGDLDVSALESAFSTFERYPHTSQEEVPARIKNAQLIICNKVILSEASLQSAKKLKVILVTATGVDHIDLKGCQKNAIAVFHAKDYGIDTVAQHTLMLLLMLARQQKHYQREMSRGAWSRQPQFALFDQPILDVSGQTLGVVGFGKIGQKVASLAKAFGMTVLVAERKGASTKRSDRVLFADCLAQSDFVTLHCPLTEETHQMMNHNAWKLMKPSSFFINTARGALVDEESLKLALEQNLISGAALDALSIEPPLPTHPLVALNHPRLILTPHQAWASQGARQCIIDQTVENRMSFVNGSQLRRII